MRRATFYQLTSCVTGASVGPAFLGSPPAFESTCWDCYWWAKKRYAIMAMATSCVDGTPSSARTPSTITPAPVVTPAFCPLGSPAADISELCGRPIALANPSANGEYVSRPRSAACSPADLAMAQAIMTRDVAETSVSPAVSGGAGEPRAAQWALGMR
jgi:hypothetical protein